MDTKLDMMSFSILRNARKAKNLAYKALKQMKAGNLDEAKELITQSDEATNMAQAAENDLLDFVQGNEDQVETWLEHSQDHLMSSMLATETIKEMIEMYEAARA
ncbi:PTS N'-diacetylchitobiose transporter subunit IIA [Erysipelotrichaceae bacterium OPF54]|uniref:PTS lactose/cellobiose transporter subunit IIA n=1 Tax=uncultured Dubosiella sp. TaxID=1937011 RepID=UPI002081D0BB|nr:PTS lactose/cellobiose transporter subunit IIA [uncultured Dubosiella sp.]GJM56959.1 PTS N'-diacetylchitobiose transporter subunit IIA [Erysipelotrichaceae bacterium OPF54]